MDIDKDRVLHAELQKLNIVYASSGIRKWADEGFLKFIGEINKGKDHEAPEGGYSIKELEYKGKIFYGVFGKRNKFCSNLYDRYESAESMIQRRKDTKYKSQMINRAKRSGTYLEPRNYWAARMH